MAPLVHNIALTYRKNRMRLSMEVQHLIRMNLLSCTETIAYLCQRIVNRIQSYSNVRSVDVFAFQR